MHTSFNCLEAKSPFKYFIVFNNHTKGLFYSMTASSQLSGIATKLYGINLNPLKN